jgi:hypothetical protein
LADEVVTGIVVVDAFLTWCAYTGAAAHRPTTKAAQIRRRIEERGIEVSATEAMV